MAPRPPPSSAESPFVALNCCDVSPWVIASAEFNERPGPLRLARVRESNPRFFAKLDATEDAGERGRIFHDYLAVNFRLHHWKDYAGTARCSLRNSYIRYLRGWEVDSNGQAAAVLKSWVLSRFGIAPTFHRKVLPRSVISEDPAFAHDRMKGMAKTNAIFMQVDLLYEFCQYELARRWPGRTHWTLFRGTNDLEEHAVVNHRGKRDYCVCLNNLVSFSDDREKAWEFGSTVWRGSIPFSKILFFSGLLPDSLLKGEGEFLVIGGCYWVTELLY